MKIQLFYQNVWGEVKEFLQRNMSFNEHIRKKEASKISNATLHLRKLDKK